MAVTCMTKVQQSISGAPVTYIGLAADTKPTATTFGTNPHPTVGSLYYAYDTAVWYITYDATNWSVLRNPNGAGLATKASASPLTTGTLFTYYGSVRIDAIIGRITTIIQHQATTVKLSVVSDSLAAYDICANKDIDQFAVGSLISITGTAADAAVSTTAVGSIAPGQANPIFATCVTSGIITVTFGAASTGAIAWECLWTPISASGLLVAA